MSTSATPSLLVIEKVQASFMIWPLGASTNEAPALLVSNQRFQQYTNFLAVSCLLAFAYAVPWVCSIIALQHILHRHLNATHMYMLIHFPHTTSCGLGAGIMQIFSKIQVMDFLLWVTLSDLSGLG